MIILDTHVWVHWVNEDAMLAAAHRRMIEANESVGVGVSIISCWEIATLVSVGRLALSIPPLEWVEAALRYPGVRLLELTPSIVVDSTQLPGTFHRDPADRLLVATARAFASPLLTRDERILSYAHVKSVAPVE